MTVRSTTYEYEQSSESGRERHIRVPYARLKDVTPALHDPFAITARTAGMEVCGTVITLNATTSEIIGNVAEGAVYVHNVRNVLTYDGANNEATWGVTNVGDPVYYDVTADANTAGICKLSTSPLQGDAATANPRFGTIIMEQTEDADDFSKGSAIAGDSDRYAVLQCGLNES